MKRTLFSEDYRILLHELRASRVPGLTQEDLGERIGETQVFVSKFERGQRRLDVLELRVICKAIGISLASFVRRLEKVLDG